MKTRRAVAVLVVVLVAALACVIPAFAADVAPIEIPDPTTFLERLAGGVVTGAVIAFLFERMQWFQALSSKARWWIVLGFTVLLPVTARLLLDLVPAAVWVAIEPYWKALGLGFIAWASTQATHVFDKLGIKLADFVALFARKSQ